MNLLYFKLAENCFTYMIHAADAQGVWWKKKSWDCNFSFQRWTLTLQTQGQATAPPSVHWGERSLPSSQQASRDVLNGDSLVGKSRTVSHCPDVWLFSYGLYRILCSPKLYVQLTVYIQLYQQGTTKSATPSWNVRKWKGVSKRSSWQDKLAP